MGWSSGAVMADTILHCFDPGSAEAEGKIIGSLLAGYGELELEMALCLIAATGNYDASLKALYSVRGEEKRIKKADRMMKVQYVNAKLAIDYKQTISDMLSPRAEGRLSRRPWKVRRRSPGWRGRGEAERKQQARPKKPGRRACRGRLGGNPTANARW